MSSLASIVWVGCGPILSGCHESGDVALHLPATSDALVIVALTHPLNGRQVEVLRWIGDGCPNGRWTDFSFKTTANALVSRRLVAVSKRGGVWSAALLPAGEYYLANEQYPRDHWAKRRRGQQADVETPVRPATIARQPVASHTEPRSSDRPRKTAPPGELTPTRKLVQAIVEAGGILEIDTTEDNTSYRSLVGIINRRGLAPDGQEVIMLRGKSYYHLVFRLSSVSDWKTEPPADVIAAERIGRWHPAVASLRADKRLDGIGKELRGRAFRLLHALAREAEARGQTVRVPTRNHYGYIEDRSKLTGELIFKVGDIECSADIRQPKDRVEHTPTPDEIEHEKKYGWGPRRYDQVPANRLSIVIETNSRFSSKESWTETKTLSLDARLPDVMMTFERWAVVDTERKEAERRAEIERRARAEQEAELARQAYVQHALGEALVAQANQWELSKRLRSYLAEMAKRIDEIPDADDRAAASDWLAWCETYAAQCDPFTKPIRRPTVKEAGYTEMQEFRNRFGFNRTFR
ncbi:hypothetical protein [Mycobacteroides abscessus]|uniref:hypothetical protein n=1 Tax=Mycobacteroides abscessus TaxID=36809 RepID=UPI001C6D176E|nr:hypothetical protein [Mycobacteroides abscessus]